MPTYEYECPDHGKFDVILTGYTPPDKMSCAAPIGNGKALCRKRAKKILSTPGGVIVEGGTNAGRTWKRD